MRKSISFLAAAAALLGAPSLLGEAHAAGTDIVRKPGSWRGTMLEGTNALIATDRYGQTLFIDIGDTAAPIFAPVAMTPALLASEFKLACLDTALDPARLGAVATQSTLGFAPRTLAVPSIKAGSTFNAAFLTAPGARAMIWSGETSALKNRPTMSRWRNGATMSGFRDSSIFSPSCALTVISTGFANPDAFVAALAKQLGAQPAKVVTKEKWADGHWVTPAADGSERRIHYSFVDLDKAEQLLHVSISQPPIKK